MAHHNFKPRCRICPVVHPFLLKARPRQAHLPPRLPSSGISAPRKHPSSLDRAPRVFLHLPSTMYMQLLSSSARRKRIRLVLVFKYPRIEVEQSHFTDNAFFSVSLRPMYLLPASSRQEHESTTPASLGVPDLPQRHEGLDSSQQSPAHFPRGRHCSLSPASDSVVGA